MRFDVPPPLYLFSFLSRFASKKQFKAVNPKFALKTANNAQHHHRYRL
jgi:hypothetical protein